MCRSKLHGQNSTTCQKRHQGGGKTSRCKDPDSGVEEGDGPEMLTGGEGGHDGGVEEGSTRGRGRGLSRSDLDFGF